MSHLTRYSITDIHAHHMHSNYMRQGKKDITIKDKSSVENINDTPSPVEPHLAQESLNESHNHILSDHR